MQSITSKKNLRDRFSCTTASYNELYARYLQNPGFLLELANHQPQHQLLDLCGGTGALTRAALAAGTAPSHITLLDLNPRLANENIRQIKNNVQDGLKQLVTEQQSFDSVICRQAFAYLDVIGDAGIELAMMLANLIKPGGKFVFNTFIRPRFHFKTYRYQGQRYIEMAGYFQRRVFHLQINLWRGYDLTISKWHKEERIYAIFNPLFKIETQWRENAMYWICTRRDK